MTSSVLVNCAWLFQPADALALDGSSTQQRTTQWRKSIVNRELCFLVRAECQCAARCIRSSGSRVGYVLGIAERESEVIAPKRRREGERELGTERVPGRGLSKSRFCTRMPVLNSIEIDFQNVILEYLIVPYPSHRDGDDGYDGGAGTDDGGAHGLGELSVRVGRWVAAVLGE